MEGGGWKVEKVWGGEWRVEGGARYRVEGGGWRAWGISFRAESRGWKVEQGIGGRVEGGGYPVEGGEGGGWRVEGGEGGGRRLEGEPPEVFTPVRRALTLVVMKRCIGSLC